MSTDYHFATPVLLRSLGALLAGAGALVLVAALLVSLLDLPGAVFGVALVVAVGLVVAGGALAFWRRTVVTFDEDGYRVRLPRAGTPQARWRDVEDAVTATVKGYECVVLRLRDGRATTIPVQVLDTPVADFMDDLRSRLDRGHGYRRLS